VVCDPADSLAGFALFLFDFYGTMTYSATVRGERLSNTLSRAPTLVLYSRAVLYPISCIHGVQGEPTLPDLATKYRAKSVQHVARANVGPSMAETVRRRAR
jgi:hypothetical protein